MEEVSNNIQLDVDKVVSEHENGKNTLHNSDKINLRERVNSWINSSLDESSKND